VETKGYKRILHLPDSPGNPEYFSDFSMLNESGRIFYAKNRSFITMKAKPVTIVSGNFFYLELVPDLFPRDRFYQYEPRKKRPQR